MECDKLFQSKSWDWFARINKAWTMGDVCAHHRHLKSVENIICTFGFVCVEIQFPRKKRQQAVLQMCACAMVRLKKHQQQRQIGSKWFKIVFIVQSHITFLPLVYILWHLFYHHHQHPACAIVAGGWGRAEHLSHLCTISIQTCDANISFACNSYANRKCITNFSEKVSICRIQLFKYWICRSGFMLLLDEKYALGASISKLVNDKLFV